MVTAPPPIAVTVVGGYLGAGKTTLVNHVLRTADARVVVLVNDFGDINIDADLIARHDGDTMELANGCICCSLVDGFAAALTTILGLERRPERLVVEASGVADPATIAAYAHTPGFSLDAIVVVADGEAVRDRSTDRYVGDTVVAQLAGADLIVLNKVDLVSDDTLGATEAWLGDRAPGAAVVRAERAVVDPLVLFGPTLDRRTDWPAPTPSEAAPHAPFESWSLTTDQPIERPAVEATMAAVPAGVLRMKGVVAMTDETGEPTGQPTPHVLQRVGSRWTIEPAPVAGPGGETRLVAIGVPGAIDDGWLAANLLPPSEG